MSFENKKIIFFDGYCYLCDGFIQFVMKVQNKNKDSIFFSPIQGVTAGYLIGTEYTQNISSIVYYKNNVSFTESSAVIEILFDASHFYFWIKILKLIPGFIRDSIYKHVAKNRYKWFGKSDVCRLPTPEEKKFFLE